MPRFFVSQDDISPTHIHITGDDAHHIGKVLRMRVGEEITLCDGAGCDYTAEIEQVSPSEVSARILSSQANDTEPPVEVWLFQALPKASKMEYITQKCTELGVCHIVPCVMSRCVVKLDGEAAMRKKVERWQSVANEAAKQSERGIIPTVEMPMVLGQAIDAIRGMDIGFAAYEKERVGSLHSVLKGQDSPKTIGYLIGPEGGIADDEAQKLADAGITAVTLGKRILRTETAGEAVLSMIMYELGDL